MVGLRVCTQCGKHAIRTTVPADVNMCAACQASAVVTVYKLIMVTATFLLFFFIFVPYMAGARDITGPGFNLVSAFFDAPPPMHTLDLFYEDRNGKVIAKARIAQYGKIVYTTVLYQKFMTEPTMYTTGDFDLFYSSTHKVSKNYAKFFDMTTKPTNMTLTVVAL